MTDMEILIQAYDLEYANKSKADFCFSSWESHQVGATRSDIIRLKDEGMIKVSAHLAAGANSLNKYRLTDKGINMVQGRNEEEEFPVPTSEILAAMDLVIGFDDIKLTIAQAVAKRKRIHILMRGPPACAKSVLLEAVRAAVPTSYLAFGSRTSSAGISEMLFTRKPTVLLLDEADKMDKDTRSVMLGLMQSGEIIETKSKKTRGVILNTQVLAACNTYNKFTPEFLSRFAFKPNFPSYTRQEFIDVCIGYLGRSEVCPMEIAALIGRMIFDYQLGDVRQGRGVWQLMNGPSESEVYRVVNLIQKYGPDAGIQRREIKNQKMLI